MFRRILGCVYVALLILLLGTFSQPAWATLPAPNQPILVVQDSSSADPYQNFVPELLTTEGLNGFQTAQLTELTGAFLANYDVVILPHLTLTSGQATLFQTYVNGGGTLVGFRPDQQLASVFGVAPLNTTLAESWLKIDTSTPYGSGLESQVMKFHGTADLYTLSGASALATLYNNPTTPTSSPAAAIYNFGSGKAILFSFDLTQSNVLMRQGNPAWAGYPNTHDGQTTMRAGQMFMDQGTGQFWNDQGDGALNDVPQADIQLRLFSNAMVVSNAAKRPLPRLWYFPNQNRTMLLMTGDQHGDDVSNSISEINTVQSAGGKFTEFLWYPFGSISNDQVNSWLAAGHGIGVHFDDTSQVDSSGIGGSAVTWSGMQSVINTALTDFATNFPSAPAPITTRDHFLIWLSRDATDHNDQTAQAKLFQNAGIEFDTTYASFPNRWGYMTGSGLPMKFLDTTTGTVIPVYEQATQYEDDIQLSNASYALNWDLGTAQVHYQKSLLDSLTKYNTVTTILFHPDHWSTYQSYAQTVLQYAQTNSIPMYTAAAWLNFWKGRAATTMSMPSFSSNTLTFTATGSPAGLTLLVPYNSGSSKAVSTFQVDGVGQSFTVAAYQGVTYASVALTAGTHNVSVTYVPAGKILGQISPSVAGVGTTVQAQGGSISASASVAADGTYALGPIIAGTYTVTPSSANYTFSPTSQSVTLGTTDVTGINFTATSHITGETLFTTQTPGATNVSDGVDEELGTVLASAVAGHITSIRFWKGSGETGTHTGRIWSGTGTLLASVTFTNETASGWQQQDLPTPLLIAANTSYVVSVSTGGTFFVQTGSGLASQVANGNLRSVVGNNGVFGAAGQFPTNGAPQSNYFRDVVFLADGVQLQSLTVSPSTLTEGNSSTGTVTLTNPAPAGGTVVLLASDNAAATVPSSVTVAAGASTANFSVSTSSVSVSTTVTISGSNNALQTATLTINPASLTNLSLSPNNLVGGSSSTGTVTLDHAAPAGGSVVTLISGDPAAVVPANVTVSAGATTATFPVTTTGVSTLTTVSILGSYNGLQTATLTINPSVLSSVSLNPTSVMGGSSSVGTVTLSGAAPAGGASVSLSSNNAAATVPASVTVTAGATTATFSVTTIAVSANATATITGSYNGTQTATLTINAAVISTLILNPDEVNGGIASSATVTLSGPAPAGGALVVLSSDNAIASVPPNVTVSAGATTATFSISTIPVLATDIANISASYLGTATATLEIDAVVLMNVSLNPATVAGGNSSTGTATLTGPAPAGGALVTLTTDRPTVSAVEGIYSSADLPQGGSVDWANVGSDYSYVDSGTVAPVAGLSGVNMTVSSATGLPMVILPNCSAGGDCGWYGNFANGARVLWVNGTFFSETGWWVANGPLTVRFDSPQRGIGFQTMSDEGGAFTATLCAYNATDTLIGCVPFKGNGTSTADGSAAFIGLYDDAQEISKVTINGGGLLYPNDFAISQVFVTDTRRQMVPASVTVPAGGTMATFPVNTDPVATTTLVNITGTFTMAQTATLTIQPPVLLTVSPTPSTVIGGTALIGTATLTGPAPMGGVVVALSADNPVSSGVQSVNSSTNMPQDALVSWTDLGGPFTPIDSGTAAPITGLPPGSTVTVSTSNGSPALVLLNCPAVADCGWGGNFVPAEPLLWVGGNYVNGTDWVGNGPFTLALSAPQRGMGFAVMADEGGPFTGTICAYNAGDTLLGCVPFTGKGAALAGGQNGMAAYVGVYDDAPEISKITVDAGGQLYPHDFSIGRLFVATSRRMVPPTATVQSGSRTATFPINTDRVSTSTTVGITGNYQGAQTGILTINPPEFSSLSVNPSNVLGGVSATGTVTLAAAAPGGGAVITLSSDNAAAVVPANVTVLAGSTSATFPITTVGVAAATAVTITGNYNGAIQTGSFAITPPAVSSVSLNPTTLLGGNASTGTVTLNGIAPAGGAIVALSSNNASATVPASVTVAAGATTATFSVSTTIVGSVASVTITGTYNGSQHATLTINPPVLSSVSVSPTSVIGGSNSVGTVTLSSAAPVGGASVTLSSDNPAAAVPDSVTVAAGATTATFTVVTSAVNANATATITGTYNGTQTTTLTIHPPALALVVMNPSAVTGGTSSTGTVALTGVAPTGGITVALSADSASVTTPANVTVAAGATTATFTVTTSAVAANVTATITGAYNGTQTATLTVNAPLLSSISLSPTSLTGGTPSTGTATLNGPAPAGGAIVTLSSNNAAATVPASATVAEGATTATFTVTTGAVAANATATITGTYNGSKTATLSIDAPVLSALALNPTTLVGGNTSAGTATLSGPAPAGGAIVGLSSNNAAATVPINVTVAAGATSAAFTVTTSGVASSVSATITGSYSGTKTATLTVNPTALASVAMSPASVTGGTSSTGTVTLTGIAPSGGISVTLSDDSTSSTTPASVTVAAGATTATFTVTTTAVSNAATVTITAVYSGVTKTSTLTINPPTLAGVTMNPTAVTGGTSSTGTVTLNGPAPTGGAVVSLSDNSSSTTTPVSATVLAGATTATFTVTSVAVGSVTSVTITGTYNGSQTATLTVNPPTLSNLTLNPTSVTGGTSSTGTVTLSSAAPTGGASVILLSDNVAATVPASVTVLAGATTATFTVTTAGVASVTTPTITGTYNGSKTATLTINPPALTTLTLNPTSVVGGNNSTGTVTLTGIAPSGGAAVTLSSNNAAATVPSSVTVAAGATTATFTVTTSGVNPAASATITGTYNGAKTATLTINPAALTSVAMNPTTVTGGISSTGTVTLTGQAPPSGAVVTLSDNNANSTTPASVTVAAGATTATFTVTTIPVSAATTSTITAVYSGVTRTASLTINAPVLVSVTMNPTAVTGGSPSTGTVTLDSPALTGGAAVTLSDNSASTTTPASVTVPAGATTATFTVTSVSVGATTSVTITATRNGVTRTAALTLNPPQVASVTLNPTTVIGGILNSTATVTLNAPAAGTGTQRTVTLSSSNTAAATVPATVTVASGATTATFTVTSKVVLATTTSTISATMNGGAQTAVLTVTP